MSNTQHPITYKGRSIGIVTLTFAQSLIGFIHVFSGLWLLTAVSSANSASSAQSPRYPHELSERKQGTRKHFLLKKCVTLNLEDVFCSKTRMKILKLLFQYGQLNTSCIAQRLGTNYETAIRHLVLLEKEGLVKQRLSGKTRFFRFTNTLKARAVVKLLEEWD